MKTIILFITFIMVLSLNAFDINALPAYSITYNKDSNPHADLAKAIQKAKVSDKKVLLLVGGDWCRWSGTFDNFLEDNEKIGEDFYNSFEVLKVYYGKNISKEGISFLKQFPALKATPHFYVLDKNLKLLQTLDSAPLERGYGYRKSKVIAFINTYK